MIKEFRSQNIKNDDNLFQSLYSSINSLIVVLLKRKKVEVSQRHFQFIRLVQKYDELDLYLVRECTCFNWS